MTYSPKNSGGRFYIESTLYVAVTLCFLLLTMQCLCGCVWLLVCLCVTVPYTIVSYLVHTPEWGLHILFNNIDIDLNYYLHTGTMGGYGYLNKLS